MSLMTCASYKSLWRGYEYFRQGKVLSCKQENEDAFDGVVKGSKNTRYHVHIDIKRTRKSACDCPHAAETRIICKHMIAVYFTAFPEEAVKYYNEVLEYEAEEQKRQEELEEKMIKRVSKMSKDDLRQILLQLLFDGPEWQYERFISEHIE